MDMVLEFDVTNWVFCSTVKTENITVTWSARRLKSPGARLFVQQYIQANINTLQLRLTGPLWEYNGDMDTQHKGRWCENHFHVTSHHVAPNLKAD